MPPSESVFALGANPVVCSATDSFNRNLQCSFTVTVVDTTPPVVTLNGGATMFIECHTVFADPGATANDTCAGALVPSVSGSVDANTPGVYTLTYSATDPASLTATATRTVTVVDTTPPVVTCAANASVSTSGGTCASNVTFSVTATDNCGTANVTCAPVSGSSFALGATTVNCFAEDGHGNTNTCSFTVTVSDTEAPAITCAGNASVSTSGGTCASNVTFSVTATDNCGTANVTCTPVSGGSFALGATTVNCFAEDSHGNTNTCSFTVTVSDTEAPAITCAANANVSTSGGSCASNVTFSVTATDNCGTANVTCSPVSGSSFALGATTVSCFAEDGHGNTNTCSFTVTVSDTEAPAIVCAGNASVSTSGGTCASNVTFSVTATDNCGTANVTCAPVSGSSFALGATTVNCFAGDGHGNTNTCSFTVTIQDDEAPIVATCPPPQTNSANAMCEGAVPDFTVGVAASDNCTMAGSLMIRQSPVAGTMLGVGTHSILIYVSDAAGNTNSSCAPIFTVRDNTPPTVMCPGPITNSTDLGVCERSLVLAVVAAMDDCGIASITSNAPPAFPVGQTTVTWTVVDVDGNTNTCTQIVVIEDREAPTLACAPVTLPASPDLCGRTNFVLTLAATNDNCGILSVTNDAPPLLPIGATIVTWLVIDVHGNSNTCQQTVTVTEVDLPIITAQPQSVTNQLGASVVLSVTATSCTNFTYQWCKDGAALPGETAATLTLNATVHADTGDYTAKVCNGAGCVTSAVARITVNRSPIARDNGAAAGGSQLIRIALPKLLNNDTDADGDALTITGVSAMSTNGGSVTLDATHVTYTPQPGFIGTDRLSYMISDGRGGSATANVVVFVADGTLPGQNQLALVPRPGGMLVRFAGIPGRSYVLQRAGMVTDPWGTLTALTAPLHGIMEYLDATPPPGMGFYRTVSP